MSKITFRKIIEETFFPINYTCNACGKEIFDGEYFCCDCNKNLPYIKENRCNHCGRLTTYAVTYCDSCAEHNISFDVARSVFDYVKPISALIKGFKYEGKRYLAQVFASQIKNLYYSEFIEADVIVYVPMSNERLKERGYNHAKLLAKELSAVLDVPVSDTAIIKTVETPRQANLSRQERRKNLQKSFKVVSEEIKDKNVLLVDDVLTTGTTADTISEQLKNKGTKKVSVLTIASVQHDNLKPIE